MINGFKQIRHEIPPPPRPEIQAVSITYLTKSQKALCVDVFLMYIIITQSLKFIKLSPYSGKKISDLIDAARYLK